MSMQTMPAFLLHPALLLVAVAAVALVAWGVSLRRFFAEQSYIENELSDRAQDNPSPRSVPRPWGWKEREDRRFGQP